MLLPVETVEPESVINCICLPSGFQGQASEVEVLCTFNASRATFRKKLSHGEKATSDSLAPREETGPYTCEVPAAQRHRPHLYLLLPNIACSFQSGFCGLPGPESQDGFAPPP